MKGWLLIMHWVAVCNLLCIITSEALLSLSLYRF